MRRSVPILAAVLSGLACAAAFAGGKGFTPKTLAGTWKGTWKNVTFKSTGSLSVKAKASGKNLKFAFNLGGPAFGCSKIPPGMKTLKPGKGANHWNSKGFTYHDGHGSFGAMTVKYTYRTKVMKGGGANPPCAKGLSWQLKGTFGAKKMTGKIHIKLPSGQNATSTVTLRRR